MNEIQTAISSIHTDDMRRNEYLEALVLQLKGLNVVKLQAI